MCLTYVNKTSISLYNVLCLKERHVQFVIEQTRFVSAVFLYSEFKLEKIYAEVIFLGKLLAVIFICGNFKYFCGSREKSQKL